MTDHDALLAAVLADPADDTRRLAYADLLREAGDGDRAALVQAQLAAPRTAWTVSGAYAAVKRGAGDPAAALLVRAGATWLAADTALLPGTDLNEWRWSRGFVTGVRLPWDDWARLADVLLGRWPIADVTLTTLPVTETRVTDCGGAEGRLVGRTRWHPVPDLGPYAGDDPFEALSPIELFLLVGEWPGVRRWRG